MEFTTQELKNGKSYVKYGYLKNINNELLVSKKNIRELWKLKPESKSSIIIFGKTVEMPRYIHGIEKITHFLT